MSNYQMWIKAVGFEVLPGLSGLWISFLVSQTLSVEVKEFRSKRWSRITMVTANLYNLCILIVIFSVSILPSCLPLPILFWTLAPHTAHQMLQMIYAADRQLLYCVAQRRRWQLLIRYGWGRVWTRSVLLKWMAMMARFKCCSWCK